MTACGDTRQTGRSSSELRAKAEDTSEALSVADRRRRAVVENLHTLRGTTRRRDTTNRLIAAAYTAIFPPLISGELIDTSSTTHLARAFRQYGGFSSSNEAATP